ncbi:hypothetical protein NC653_030203 [Populus alba x Populus x berolinensis]|uniref:Uncharacterized protein n=1 Tax=Populus alba x Populus x berolinensis TaxID=444605 RepID=A0AAD6PZY3_9ROSI|nr:hypothetical protein NC653_030203 [Populus alba x Populus x berolinensis]
MNAYLSPELLQISLQILPPPYPTPINILHTKQNKKIIRIFEQTRTKSSSTTSLPLQLSSSTSSICTLNAVTLTKPSDMVTISRDRESICS